MITAIRLRFRRTFAFRSFLSGLLKEMEDCLLEMEVPALIREF